MWISLNHFHPENVVNWLEDRVRFIGAGSGFPYDISNHRINNNNFTLYDGNVLFLSDNSFVALNGSAKQICIKNHNFSNPAFRCNEGRYIIYDMGGNDYRIDTLSKTLHTSSCENKIVCCDISKTGMYGILSESKDFLNEMTIYDKANKEKYKYYFANMCVSGIAVSNNSKTVSTCGFGTKDGALTSFVYVHDLKSEEPKYQFEFNDNMLFFIGYFSNGNIAAVGDKGLSILNPKAGTRKDIEYNKKTLSCFDFDKNQGIVYNILPTNSGQNGEIILIGIDGSISSKIPTETKFQSISHKENKVAALSENKIYMYNISGNLEKIFDTSSIPKSIKLSSPSKAYVMQENKIYSVNLK
ncbi:MAG: DUF5711 family protein [Oscillospiraceae bacterium]|nr:DUF5711 family protein [Oscillospiraceae bacterium]